MNLPNPPFDPPYVITSRTDTGMRRIEVLPDGTTREVLAPPVDIDSTLGMGSSASGRVPSAAKASSGGSQGKTYLQVPFAEKDAAKNLGARWDAAARKWYVAKDAELDAFSRWLPERNR